MADYYTYIVTNHARTLYAGVTNDLVRRVDEHRQGIGSAFTTKYHCGILVWFERFSNANDAIAFEKKIKGGSRAKKIALIEATNPAWHDLMPHVNIRHPEGA